MQRAIEETYLTQENEKLFRARDGKGMERVFRRPQDVEVFKRDGGSQPGFINSTAIVAGATKEVMAIVRGSIIAVVTNIGSPVSSRSRTEMTADYFSAAEHQFSCPDSVGEKCSDH